MSNRLKPLLIAFLLGLVLLTNTACPPIDITPSEFGTWDDVDWAYDMLYKGMLLNWYVPQTVAWPGRVMWTLPLNVDFTGFQPNTVAGILTIDGNFDRQINTPGTDYAFYVRGSNTMSAFTDFDGNGSAGPNDATINYNSGARRFDMNFTGPRFMGKGAYSLDMMPTFFSIKTGPDNALGDVSLDIFGTGATTVHRNLLFLNNTTILPRIAYGDLGGGSFLTSQLVVSNPTGIAQAGTVKFFTDGGAAYPVELSGTTSSQFSWTLQPYNSRTWEPSNPQVPVTAGWGFAQGTNQYAVLYGIYGNPFKGTLQAKGPGEGDPAALGSLQIEAGISPSAVSTRHVINVLKAPGGIDTAFSIVNPTSATASMTLILSEGGVERARKTATLAPKNAIARFFTEFFELNAASFSGAVLIKSDTSLATTSLKTLNGQPSGSLPSGIFEIR